jgi:choline-sulfatase
MSEYHAVGSTSAVFMLRSGKYKYVHYVGYPAQLFDLEQDPEELTDRAADPDHASVVARFEAALRSMLDPEAVDRRAKQRQSELVEQAGGRAAILSGHDFGWTPVPASQ